MSKDNIVKNGNVGVWIKGVVIGVAVFFAMILLFAAVMLFFETDRSFAPFFATVSLAAGSFAASYYTAGKTGDKGYRTGFVIGFAAFAVITLIAFLTQKTGFSLQTLFHFVIVVLSATIGGILGVNKGKNKKYI